MTGKKRPSLFCAADKPKVGVLALTLELYESLAPDLRSQCENWLGNEALPALGAHAEVVFDRAVFRREDIDAQVASLEVAGCDALLVVLLTYSPSQLALPALQRTRLPVAIWNTQPLWGVDETFTPQQMSQNHGVHGTQDLANVLLRSGVDFHYVTSHLCDDNACEELGDFFAAAAAVRRLRHARLGLLGYPFPGMGDFAFDSTRLVATLGCELLNLPLEDCLTRAEAALAEDVSRLVAEYRAAYAVDKDITDADLAASARMELALRSLVDEHDLSALTYQFLAFGEDERSLTLPFLAASRLLAEGVGFGGEGDLVACAGTCLLNSLCPPATFSEIFTTDFAHNAVLMSHMGEANVAMARTDRPVPLRARAGQITRTREKQLALAMNLRPGPVTLAALTPGPGGRWRIIASRMTAPDTPALDLPAPHFKLEPDGGDIRDWLTAYATSAGPHHNAVCFGDGRPRLRLAAHLLDAEYCEV